MNEASPPVLRRPWRGPAWFVLLYGASFLIICVIGLLTQARLGDLVPLALICSGVAALVTLVGLGFIRWLCRWQNFRRFLFVLACLVTLVVLAYTEETWRGKSAWETHRREWEAKGQKFGLASLVPAPVPDEKNFAFTPLLKPALDFTSGPKGIVWADTNGLARLEALRADLAAHRDTNDRLILGNLDAGTLADVGAWSQFYRGNTNYPQAPASATPAETVLVALSKFDSELQQLRQAAASRPYARFPVNYQHQPTWAILSPHLTHVKGLAVITHVSATARLEAGQAAEAFADLQLGFRFADALREEPLLIGQLVRLSILGIDMQTVREGLVRHAWMEAQLAEVEGHLASANVLAGYELAMLGERACETEGVDYLRREASAGEEIGDLPRPLARLIPSGWYYQNMLTISRMMEEYALPVVDDQGHRVFPELTRRGQQALLALRPGPYNFFARMLLPALQNAALRFARGQVSVDATRVACALERYRLANGQLPDTLTALTPRFLEAVPIDVIDGKPLRYSVEAGSGYRLYSIGWNETDDGGQIAWTKSKSERRVDLAQGDWVWQMPGR